MILEEAVTLSNGVEIPKIGLGTWMIPNSDAKDAVKNAVSLGYRHIDTAQVYLNEEGVGKGINSCGVSREELFVTSKVAAEIKNYSDAKKSIDETLKRINLDYIDLMLIHCPQPWEEFRGEKRYFAENKEVWKALEEAYEEKKVRSIGVSNFLIDDLENIFTDCKIKPMVNQFLTHISETPLDLIEFCKKENIVCEAYSPIAHGKMLNNPIISEFASKYGVSVARFCIRYTLQLGMVSLPKTANPDRMKENIQVDFEITEKDMEKLKKLKF